MKITSPTVLELNDIDAHQHKDHFVFINKKVDFEIQKFKNNTWFSQKYGEEAYQEHLSSLQEKRKESLLFQRDDGSFWTYSGLAKFLQAKFQNSIENQVIYPEPGAIPWEKVLDKTPRPYQEKIVSELIKVKHGAVEVGTGLGKSLCLLLLAKHYGLKTVVMTPSVSIAEQIFRDFQKYLGRKRVGAFFDGKRDVNKLFVVAVAASLARVEEGGADWKELSSAQVFLADESHLCPASTLAKVCFGLLKDAPYRYFFSGTQMRNDGLDLLLRAITGDIVYQMTVQQGVEQEYLSKPMFRMVSIESRSSFFSKDANDMTRKHLYYNNDVNRVAGDIANKMVSTLKRPVLILIDEMEQFSKLLPYLKHKVAFAHGGLTKKNSSSVPEEYHKSDPNALVEAFNNGEYDILVGTSCVSTGTDIRACKAIIYLQGGKSEIQVKQAVGRGTRRTETKSDCFFIDFDVKNIPVVHRHALVRKEIYRDIYPDFQEMSYK